jgi:L-iditol 2-dehydrogenase
MLALRKQQLGSPELSLQNVPEPTATPSHVVIDVAAAGICGTDLHIIKDEYRCAPPVTLSHEVAGVIAEVGAGVKRWQVGQRVVTETYFSVCARCEHCRSGRPNLCGERASIGSFRDGGFAKRLLVPEHNLHLLPDTLAFPEAALVEPLACVVRGLLELGRITAGDRAVITGPGAIGLLAVQVAKAAGARVVVVGTAADRERLELAARLGADLALETTQDTVQTQHAVHDYFGAAPDVAIECSGAAPAATFLMNAVAKAGRFIQVGLYGKPIQLDLDQVCYRELQLTGSFATTPSSWRRALALAGSGAVSLKGVVGRTYPLSEWSEAFAAVQAGTAGKVLLIP